jgi:hypothetical protein
LAQGEAVSDSDGVRQFKEDDMKLSSDGGA